MKYDISILIPGIRLNLWLNVYHSLEKSFKGKWEIIFVGPYNENEVLEKFKDIHINNITFIESYASPMICRQQALIASKGDFICYAADDVIFCDNSLQEAFNALIDKDYMNLVVGKYLEGEESQEINNQTMRGNEYWYLNYHDFLRTIMIRFPENYFLINTGLIPRRLMIEIGGWDCKFEACAMGCVDLSLRLQIYGAKCILQNNPIFYSSHLNGSIGDHKPIHNGQIFHDMPLFLYIWSKKEYLERIVIQLDNWKNYSNRWERRFGKAEK